MFFNYLYIKEKTSKLMGIIAKEDGVLKLVHPGRYVEVHRQPITAAQVLKNNPRHSITRPDVFEYPWIVVKPDSLLHLGKVFFIVPNCTIYNLLKANSANSIIRPCQTQFSKHHHHHHHHACGQVQKRKSVVTTVVLKHRNNHHHQWFKQSLPITSCIGTTSFKEQDCDKRFRNPPGKSAGMTLNQHQSSLCITSCIGTSFQEQDCDKSVTKKPAKAESWPKLISKYRNTHLDFEEKPEEESLSTSEEDQYCFINVNTAVKFPRKNERDLKFNCMEDVMILKSCLRKPDSVRRLLRLRVSFTLPDEDEEQQRAEITSNYSCGSSEVFVPSTNLIPTFIA